MMADGMDPVWRRSCHQIVSCVGVGGATSSSSSTTTTIVGCYQTAKCTHCTSVQVYSSNKVEIGIACIGFITGAAR